MEENRLPISALICVWIVDAIVIALISISITINTNRMHKSYKQKNVCSFGYLLI